MGVAHHFTTLGGISSVTRSGAIGLKICMFHLVYLLKKRINLNGSERLNTEAVAKRWSVRKVFLEISKNSQGNTCARISFLIKFQASNFLKKETLAQVLSCEYCEISKNTFCYRTPPAVASVVKMDWKIFEKDWFFLVLF